MKYKDGEYTAFAWQFTWGCKFEGKCSIYYLCPCFNRSVHFFAPNLQRVNLVQIKFFVRCLLRAVRRACRFCLVGQALYAARALLFSSLASVISSVWESNQSAVLLVFLPKMEKAALLKFSHQSHALPLCAPGFVSHSALRLLASGENQVKLVPVLRSWVSPGDCVGACYWRTRSWNRVCDEGIALEGLGCFRSSSQCRNNPSKWAMTFDQHQLWRWSNREWTVSSSFSVIPLMVIASSWYNLSFASPGDDRIGAWALIRDNKTTDEWSCSEKILSLPSADEAMDPSRVLLTVKTNAMFPGLIWWFPLPEKEDISFHDRSWIWQPRL